MASLFGGIPYSKRPVPTPDSDGIPKWATKLSSWLAIELGNLSRRTAPASTRTITGDTDVLATDGMILCDTTSQAISVTWSTPLPKTKDWVITIARTSAGAHNVTIVGTVSGVVSPTLTAQYKTITIWSDGTTLWKIAST